MINFIEHNSYLVRKFIKNYEDGVGGEPTFLTFSIDFVFDVYQIPQLSISNSPLFDTSSNYSAVSYLKSRGFEAESRRLNKFIEVLKYLSQEEPWFFQSIVGLKEMWAGATDMAQNFKGKEKKLTVGTLESLDLSITYLADLYRKSVYDSFYMRELVPENLRYFQVDVYVAEFRDLQIFDNDIDKMLIQLNPLKNQNKTFFEKYATFNKFVCHMCEFDFSNSFAGGDALNVHTPEMAINTFDIKVNWFMEQHSFGFDDIITAESLSKHLETEEDMKRTPAAQSKFSMNKLFGMVNDARYAAGQIKNIGERNILRNNPAVNTGRNIGRLF